MIDDDAIEVGLLALGVLGMIGFAAACAPVGLREAWRFALGASSLLTYVLVLAVAGLFALRRWRHP